MRRAGRAFTVAVALAAALVPGARTVGADCPPERNAPNVIFVGQATRHFDRDLGDILANDFFSHLVSETSGVTFFNKDHVALILGRNASQQGLGEQDDIPALATALGSPFQVLVTFDETRTGNDPVVVTRTMIVSLTDTHEATLMRRFQTTLPNNDSALFTAMRPVRLQFMDGLRCALLAARTRPAVPKLIAALTPAEVAPGGTVHVNAKLTDSSTGEPQGGRQIRMDILHGRVIVDTTPRFVTDEQGVVNADLNVGGEPGPQSIVVSFVDARGRTTPSSPEESLHYTVLDPAGDLHVRAAEAALHTGGGETLTAQFAHAGAPVAGTAIAFAPSGGVVSDPSVVTDANGYASTQFQAPDTNAVVDVTVSAPALPAKGPKSAAPGPTASLTLVVDGGVTLSVNALDTVASATSDVTADLVVGGLAIPATEVNFSLVGAGALSAASATTDDAGRAEVTWLAPAGVSTADITAETVVDGQRYTKTVTVHAGAVGPGMTVRVSPSFSGSGFLTYVTTATHDANGQTAGDCTFATLAGAFACDAFQLAPDYGSASDAPVTIRAEADAGYYAYASVTRTEPRVAVLDLGGKHAGGLRSVSQSLNLELGLTAAGTLQIAVDTTSFPFPGQFQLVLPKTGGALGDATNWVLVNGSTSVDIAGPEALQIFVSATRGQVSTNAGPAYDGVLRVTFTFRTQ